MDIAAAVGASTKAVQRLIYAGRKPPLSWLFASETRLTLSDREEISRGLLAGESLRSIARRLERAPSTIARGVARNGGRSKYRAWRATRSVERNGLLWQYLLWTMDVSTFMQAELDAIAERDLELATNRWVAWFNRQRLHEHLGYSTPIEIEASYVHQQSLPRLAA